PGGRTVSRALAVAPRSTRWRRGPGPTARSAGRWLITRPSWRPERVPERIDSPARGTTPNGHGVLPAQEFTANAGSRGNEASGNRPGEGTKPGKLRDSRCALRSATLFGNSTDSSTFLVATATIMN